MSTVSISPDVDVRANVDLRRLDWRYLLPLPEAGQFRRLVVPGGDEALAAAIVSLGIAESVNLRLTGKRDADAVVALYPSQVTPALIAESLAPDGVFYSEHVSWWTSAALARRRARRAFAQARLFPTGVYWALPAFLPCQMYIPLDVSGGLRWYMDTLFAPSTRLQRALQPGLRALGRLDARAVFPVSHYAVVGTAGGPPRTEGLVYAHPALPIHDQETLHPLLITAGNDTNRVVIAPFTARGRQPVAIVKLARHPTLNDGIGVEQRTLARLRASLDAGLQRTLPQPLGRRMWSTLAVGIETPAPGRSLAAISRQFGMSQRRHIAHLQMAAEWLIQFHRAAEPGSGAWRVEDVRVWVDRPTAEYEAIFGVTDAEEALFAALRRQARSLLGAACPTVWNHWGFEERNLFVHGSTLTVIDWEDGRLGPPLLDLLYFVMRWSAGARGQHSPAGVLESFRDVFLCEAGGQVEVAARDIIRRYMAALDLDHHFYPLLLVLVCVHRAIGRFKAEGALQVRAGNARARNPYVDYVGVLAENVDRIFGVGLDEGNYGSISY